MVIMLIIAHDMKENSLVNANRFESDPETQDTSKASQNNRILQILHNYWQHRLFFHWNQIPLQLIEQIVDFIEFTIHTFTDFTNKENKWKWTAHIKWERWLYLRIVHVMRLEIGRKVNENKCPNVVNWL